MICKNWRDNKYIQSSEMSHRQHFVLSKIYQEEYRTTSGFNHFFTFLIKYTNKALLDLFSLALHAQSRLMRYQERTGQCLAILPPKHPSGTRISAPRVSLYSTDLLVLSAFPCHFLLPFNKELQSSITSWQETVTYVRYI